MPYINMMTGEEFDPSGINEATAIRGVKKGNAVVSLLEQHKRGEDGFEDALASQLLSDGIVWLSDEEVEEMEA